MKSKKLNKALELARLKGYEDIDTFIAQFADLSAKIGWDKRNNMNDE
jgi:hypothetical protein